MKTILLALLALLPITGSAAVNPDWTTPQTPFRIAGNLYYVGSRDLAAYLVTTPAGNILINSNLAMSPPQIRAAVESLGFRWRDIRILLISQAHYDHAAGAAQILRETGARLEIMQGDVAAIQSGDAHDFGGPELTPFTPAHVSRILHDGSAITLGGVTLIAHRTPGHTRGCTTFTLDVPGSGRNLHVVIGGGFTALTSYRLIATPGHPASYPGILQDFQRSIATLRALPCDIYLGAHGLYFDMQQKLTQLPARGPSIWVDPSGCRTAADSAQRSLDQHLAGERNGSLPHS